MVIFYWRYHNWFYYVSICLRNRKKLIFVFFGKKKSWSNVITDINVVMMHYRIIFLKINIWKINVFTMNMKKKIEYLHNLGIKICVKLFSSNCRYFNKCYFPCKIRSAIQKALQFTHDWLKLLCVNEISSILIIFNILTLLSRENTVLDIQHYKYIFHLYEKQLHQLNIIEMMKVNLKKKCIRLF